MDLGQFKRFAVWLGVACVFAAGPAHADVESMRIGQVNPQLPVLTAYVDISFTSASASTTLRSTDFSGSDGSHPLKVVGMQSFDSSGEGVAYIFLIDISRSITPAQFAEMQTAMRTWVQNLRPGDVVAISTFGDDYQQLSDFTDDREQLQGLLSGLRPIGGETHLHQAVVRALAAFQRRQDRNLPARRVIVLLSDGKDEGSGMTADDVVARIRANQLPIYAIGFSGLPQAERRTYLDVLHRFADVSGGMYREAETEPLAVSYGAIQQAIRNVLVLRLACEDCQADGQPSVLQVKFSSGKVLTDEREVRLKAGPPERRWWKRIPWWGYALAAAVLISLIVVVLLRRRRRDPESMADAPGPVDGWRGLPPNPTEAVTGSLTGPAVRIRLTVVSGAEPGRIHDVRLLNTAKIGRNPECEVVIEEDPKVSSKHCELALSKDKVVIYDLGSTNKTLVNGVTINGRHRLEDRDSIVVGQTEMRVRMGEVR